MQTRFTVLARSTSGRADVPIYHCATLAEAVHYSRPRLNVALIVERSRAYPFETVRRYDRDGRVKP